MLLSKSDFLNLKDDEQYEERLVRCRTIGDMTCTGVSESDATSLEDIIDEVASTRVTERGEEQMINDQAAMEDRKKAGYF